MNDVTKEKCESWQDGYAENERIKTCVKEFRLKEDGESVMRVLQAIAERIMNEGEAPTPMVDQSGYFDQLTADDILERQEIRLDRDVRLTIDLMQSSDNKKWIPLFTNNEEVEKLLQEIRNENKENQ